MLCFHGLKKHVQTNPKAEVAENYSVHKLSQDSLYDTDAPILSGRAARNHSCEDSELPDL